MEVASYKNVYDIAMGFHPETMAIYDSWLNLGKILFNLQNKLLDIPENLSMLDLWLDVSKRVDGFEQCYYDDCVTHWNNFEYDNKNLK